MERWLPDGPRLKPVAVVDDYRTTIFDELNLTRSGQRVTTAPQFLAHRFCMYPKSIGIMHTEYDGDGAYRRHSRDGLEALAQQHTDMKCPAERANIFAGV